MSYVIERQRAADIAYAALSAGFRVFLAEGGRYGFFTDSAGTRVVSFQGGPLAPSVSGNYSGVDGKKHGTGWQITEWPLLSEEWIERYFNAQPYGMGRDAWRYTTLEEHLARYGASSRYTEIESLRDASVIALKADRDYTAQLRNAGLHPIPGVDA